MGTFAHLTLDEVTSGSEEQILTERSNIAPSAEVVAKRRQIEEEPKNYQLWIELGLALAKQKLFREAIEAYSMYITFDPFNGLVYRHRGHRLLSVHRYQEAAADLELGSRLDPTNWDTWYHLGLSYYLLGDYQRALAAYKRCHAITKDTGSLVAVLDWEYMTLGRLGRREEAEQLLNEIDENTDYDENYSYFRRLLMYKGLIKPEELIITEGAFLPALEIATQGYGLANYYYLNGQMEKYHQTLCLIIEAAKESMWSAFGYLAACEDAKRQGLICCQDS